MERPIFIVAIFALIAAFSCIFIGPVFNIWLALIGGLVISLFKSKQKLSSIYYLCLIIIPIITIRFLNINSQAKMLKGADSKNTISCELRGYVSNLEIDEDKTSFIISNGQIYRDGSLEDRFSVKAYSYEKMDIMEGDYVTLEGKLSNFDRARNEGNFDSYNYYASLGIKGKYLISNLISKTDKNAGIKPFLYKLKSKMIAVYNNNFTPKKAGLVIAMTLGNKSDLDENIKSDFRTSGIAHLLSISALHVSLVGVSIYKLLKRKLGVFYAGIISSFIMLSYLIITGNGISCRRAVIMIICLIVADNIGRCNDLITTISLSILVLVIDNPYVLCNTGFLLSFLAMAGIAFLYPILFNEDRIFIFIKRSGRRDKGIILNIFEKIIDMGILSFSIQIMTLPAILWTNFETPIYSVILNIIVIPLMSLLMVSAFLSGLIGIAFLNISLIFSGVCNFILDLYLVLVKINLSLWHSILVTGRPRIRTIVIYYILIVFFVIIYKLIYDDYFEKYVHIFQRLIMCLLVLFILNLFSLHYVLAKGLNISMIDVGQGDCILLTCKNETFLFDAGSSDLADVYKYRIESALLCRGIDRINTITISHFDADHVNGIISLLESNKIKVGTIAIPNSSCITNNDNFKKIKDLSKKLNIRLIAVNSGLIIANKKIDGLDFKITCLHPSTSFNLDDANEISASYLINYGNFKMLTIGDAGSVGEACIMENAKSLAIDIRDVDLLKVGHHGSKTSSSFAFVNTIKPDIGLISCGVNNRYKHPNKETLDTFSQFNTKLFISSECGQTNINVSKDKRIFINTRLYKLSYP